MNPGRWFRAHGSSVATHDALSLGYVVNFASLPNALLLSMRSAAVMKSRLLKPNSCCPYAPSVLFCTSDDVGVPFVPVAVTVDRPGVGKCWPDAARLVCRFV